MRPLEHMQAFFGFRPAVKPRRAEENDGVLDAFPSEASQRLLVFGKDAKNASVGAVEELLVLIRQRRAIVAVLIILLVRHVILKSPIGARRHWCGERRASGVRALVIAHGLGNSPPDINQT